MASENNNGIGAVVRRATIQAIRHAQREIRWKPGKDSEHLSRRIHLGQLPPDADLQQYEAVIHHLLRSSEALVYLYFHADVPYPVIIADWNDHPWAVIIGMDGVMETAFLLLKPEQYIERRGLVYIGRLQEIVNE